MERITEYLRDRPRDAIYWIDAAIITLIVFLLAIAVIIGAWLIITFGLQMDVLLGSVFALQPERDREPNPDAEDDAHDADVQRKVDDEMAAKRNASLISAEVLSLQDAFAEGARAGNMGTAPSLNPYQHDTPEHAEWERGRMGAIGFKLSRSA